MRLVVALTSVLAITGLGSARAAVTQATQPSGPAGFLPTPPLFGPFLNGVAPQPLYHPGLGVVSLGAGPLAAVPAANGASYVDSMQVLTSSYDVGPGLALMRPGAVLAVRTETTFAYRRDWPSALSFGDGAYSLDITPHAGLGFSSGGGQAAEAGALLSLGKRVESRMMDAVGFNRPGSSGRWFLFAGASGRSVGLNPGIGQNPNPADAMSQPGGWEHETQAGLGFSRGALSASLGFTREQVTLRAMGQDIRDDNRVGLVFSIH